MTHFTSPGTTVALNHSAKLTCSPASCRQLFDGFSILACPLMSYQYDMSPTADPGIGFEPDRLQAIDFQRNDANRAALREYLKLGIVGIWKKDSGHRDFPVIAEDLSGCDVSLEGNGQVQWRNGEGWITRAFQHFIRSPHFQPLQTAFDEVEGDSVKNLWGDKDGTINGDAKIGEGIFGNGMEFDGNGDYIRFDDSGLPEGDAPRTMSAWVKPEGAGVRTVFEWGMIGWCLKSGVRVVDGQFIEFVGAQNCDHINCCDVTSNSSIPLSEWSLVTETYDGATIRIYLNGELDSTVIYILSTMWKTPCQKWQKVV